MKKKKRTKTNPLLIIAGVVVLIGIAIGAWYGLEVSGSQKGTPVTVTIEQGAGPVTIANQLKEADVIGNTTVFRIYLKFTGAAPELQYGTFELRTDMPYAEIVETLKAIHSYRETVTVTFPEGSTLIQFAQRMEAAGLCTQEEFIEVATNGDFSEFTFWQYISDNPNKFMKTEGFLFPDTYDFFTDESVDSMVRKIYKHFDEQITPEMYARMDELGLTLEETIVLASYIQEEAGDPVNMPYVSEVMHNRLTPGSPYPKLECDVSWHFIYDFIEPYYGGAANTPQYFYDYYDSYEVIGLPIGALSSPGIDAINAALYPANTPDKTYYFFITDKAGKYYYAETWEQHQANIAEANRVNASIAS